LEHPKVNICGIKHSCIDYDAAISTFGEWIARRDKAHQVCISNVHTTVMCRSDKELAEIANKADMVTIDGQPLRWYANHVRGAKLNDRICGPDLMIRCIEAGLDRGWKHYFLGGKIDVLLSLCERLKGRYPEVKIAGSY
jgi:N-acetylglucosaminyldiphosphoundecaprenol N-acetyl-beta-D-mannosaminyltransferase